MFATAQTPSERRRIIHCLARSIYSPEVRRLMKVRFWGTRGSIATPGPATNHFGGNTSCVEVTTANGDLLIFDCGTGARQLAAELMVRSKKAINANILLGHTHWDHIQGFPFFTPAFLKGNSVAIYGPEGSRGSLQQALAGQMEYTYFPVDLNQLPAAITYHDLTEGIHTIGGARVATQFLNHPAMTVGYRVEADGVAVVYLVDHEPFSDALWRAGAEPGRIESILHDGDRRHAEFMAGADLVIHDAQYTPEEYPSRKTWGHSAYDYGVQIAAAAGVRRVALTHHDPSHDDHFVADIERRARALALQCGTGLDVFCAYEGCELLPESRSVLKPFVAAAQFQASVAQRHFHVLAVDDQPDMLAMIVRALEDDQYTVTRATSGPEALRMINEHMPDLVVLDYKMTDMDGLAVMKTLRAKPETQRLPVLMLTAMTDEPSTRAGFEAGVTDYVTKPFSIPQLTARVRACLTRSQVL
jgi:CheY-like chemotaxis protein/glyoxylase-like metal-dependent hydrolase (beta-lactamase superfamily II)